jgi:hypothetical protein
MTEALLKFLKYVGIWTAISVLLYGLFIILIAATKTAASWWRRWRESR